MRVIKKVPGVHSPIQHLEISATKKKLPGTTVSAGIEIWANRNRILSEVEGTQLITSCCEICALRKHLGLKVVSGQAVD